MSSSPNFGFSIPEGARWSSGIEAAIGARGRGLRPVHYITVAATLDKSLTSHCSLDKRLSGC